MNRRNTNWLIVIVILLILSSWVTFSKDIVIFGRDIKLKSGAGPARRATSPA